MQVETLFHEFGHALNSLLCRNRLQHLSGARGPLDIVELPSHIFEKAAQHPPLHQDILRSAPSGPKWQVARKLLAAERSMGSNFRALHSLLLPNLDAALHGMQPPVNVLGLQKLAVNVAEGVMGDCVAPPPLGSYPGLSLEHILSYGGACHAYEYADKISDAVWKHHLNGNSCNTEPGRGVADALYAPGGAVDVKTVLAQMVPGCLVEVEGGLAPALPQRTPTSGQ
jgi:Zn-dependent oligopeptidase